MSDTATVSLRLPVDLIERIDYSAGQAGLNRTEYVTSWLPDTYDQPASTTIKRREAATKQRR